jgi:hypothetical protein
MSSHSAHEAFIVGRDASSAPENVFGASDGLLEALPTWRLADTASGIASR